VNRFADPVVVPLLRHSFIKISFLDSNLSKEIDQLRMFLSPPSLRPHLFIELALI